MSHTTWIEIDREALRHNVRSLRRLTAPAAFMAVVKGNAYGHGMIGVARTIEDEVDWFGVNSVDEAAELADAGCARPILIMGGAARERLAEVVRRGFRQVVYDAETVAALADEARHAGVTAPVHLKVETGTNRLGVRPEGSAELAALVRARPELRLEGLYTHFANVEDTLDGSYAEHQLHRFQEARAAIEADGPVPVIHSAATAASILYRRTYFNLVRVGIGLYGLWPSDETREAACRAGVDLDLRPVLTWKARVVHLNDVPFGEPVGYGCTYVATRPRRIAVLPVGYYEGVSRALSNRGRVLVRGQVAPITGRVAMNMCMVDVTDIPGVQPGDEAVLIGRQGDRALTAEDMASQLNTINYEVVTRIAASVPRIVVDDTAAARFTAEVTPLAADVRR